MWAVGVVAPTYATLRVKKIDDCNVDTAAQTMVVTGIPLSEADILNVRLTKGSLFGLPNCTPIITKVKNFKIENNLVSFDAQIKFVVGTDYPGTECQ